MRIAVDTNILVRAVTGDDPVQSPVAGKLLREASLVTVAAPCLCEFVWVLRGVYRMSRDEVASAIRALISASNVEVDRSAVEATATSPG